MYDCAIMRRRSATLRGIKKFNVTSRCAANDAAAANVIGNSASHL